MKENDTPLHHYPLTQGLDLATHESVVDAWDLFFAACWDLWEEVQRRRAAKQAKGNGEEAHAQKECA